MTTIAPAPMRSPFLRTLRRNMLIDLEPELVLACKVGVLLTAGWRRSEIQRRLGATPAEMRIAEQRVRRAAQRMDAGE
jgi:hypothetical protein